MGGHPDQQPIAAFGVYLDLFQHVLQMVVDGVYLKNRERKGQLEEN